MERNTLAVLVAAAVIAGSTVMIATGFAATGLGNWIERFGTVFVGIAAVTTAGFAIRTPLRLSERNRRQDLAAAIAVLPLALREMSDYARQSVVWCNALFHNIKHDHAAPDPNLPAVPEGQVSTYRDCIKAADAPLRERLSDILLTLQIQNSRLHGLVRPGEHPSQHWTLQVLINSAELYALSNSLRWWIDPFAAYEPLTEVFPRPVA